MTTAADFRRRPHCGGCRVAVCTSVTVSAALATPAPNACNLTPHLQYDAEISEELRQMELQMKVGSRDVRNTGLHVVHHSLTSQ
jgi:hypothetical protein